jgi:hypothetical protein
MRNLLATVPQGSREAIAAIVRTTSLSSVHGRGCAHVDQLTSGADEFPPL